MRTVSHIKGRTLFEGLECGSVLCHAVFLMFQRNMLPPSSLHLSQNTTVKPSNLSQIENVWEQGGEENIWT
jgi:hypothetical protein